MFKFNKDVELCQISLTGLRALVILGLLIDKPHSLKELREKFLEYDIMEDSNSDDIIRIDLNTLKAMGCEISRACKKTNQKFILLKHPFAFNITEEELTTLKRAYRKIIDNTDIETLVKYDELFNKLSKQIFNETHKEVLLGISVLKSYDNSLIRELLEDCKYHKTLKLTYKPASKEPEEKEIYAQKLMFQNDKIYLLGNEIKNDKQVMLNIKRIVNILSRRASDKSIETKNIKVKFLLTSFGVTGIVNEETILETTPEGYIIEGSYYNEFVAIQRILSLGSSCTVIEPDSIKQKVIQKLKNMRAIYHE